MISKEVPNIVVLVLLLSSFGNTSDPLLIETQSGWVRGKSVKTETGKVVQAYLGIPFAEPPVGHLRFRHPKPVQPWTDVFNATSLPNSCVQVSFSFFQHIPFFKKIFPPKPFDEDCLRLNVWVPPSSDSPLPVIVFIYGGAYSFGSTSTTITVGDTLAGEGDVIVVTFNYRVASLGFLFLDDTDVPGNAGLYDQKLAMEWVYDNIASFGGDPDNITLYGQSSGASSVLIHLISRKSDHIINRVILSSVPRLSYVIVDREAAVQTALQLAENSGCPSNVSDVTAIAECLRNIEAGDLVRNEPAKEYNYVIFFPVVDGDIVPRDWKKRFTGGKVKAVDVLIGDVKNEGSTFLPLLLPVVFRPDKNDVKPRFEDYELVLRAQMDIREEILNIVTFQYTDWLDTDKPEKILDCMDKTLADVIFVCPLNRYEIILRKTSRVYRYHMVHPPVGSQASQWFGVFHTADLFYVFGYSLVNAGPSVEEKNFANRMIRYWTNFARTGNPNQRPDGTLEEVLWPESLSPDGTYLVLSPNSTTAGRSYRVRNCAFWDLLVPEIARQEGLPLNQIERFIGL